MGVPEEDEVLYWDFAMFKQEISMPIALLLGFWLGGEMGLFMFC